MPINFRAFFRENMPTPSEVGRQRWPKRAWRRGGTQPGDVPQRAYLLRDPDQRPDLHFENRVGREPVRSARGRVPVAGLDADALIADDINGVGRSGLSLLDSFAASGSTEDATLRRAI